MTPRDPQTAYHAPRHTQPTALPRIVLALCVVGTFSSAIPVLASMSKQVAPSALRVADLGASLVLFWICVALRAREGRSVTQADKAQAWRLGQMVCGVIPVLLVLFLSLPAVARWDVLVVGLAWRAWLLLYTLPFVAATLRRTRGIHSSGQVSQCG